MKHTSCTIPIKVDFFIKGGVIQRVALAQHAEPHLTWHVHATHPFPQLEESINTWMTEYGLRKQPTIDLPVLLDGIPGYTEKVLLNLRKIPFGQVLTYGELADRSGNKAAARAIGNACARNPCPLIIPCHRILASGHQLGGFSCGLEIKEHLLRFEGHHRK